MKLKKVNAIPPKRGDSPYVGVIASFEKSKALFMELELTQEEKADIYKTYNSLYQACKRNTRVKVRRCNNTLYLVKIDENGEEL